MLMWARERAWYCVGWFGQGSGRDRGGFPWMRRWSPRRSGQGGGLRRVPASFERGLGASSSVRVSSRVLALLPCSSSRLTGGARVGGCRGWMRGVRVRREQLCCRCRCCCSCCRCHCCCCCICYCCCCDRHCGCYCCCCGHCRGCCCCGLCSQFVERLLDDVSDGKHGCTLVVLVIVLIISCSVALGRGWELCVLRGGGGWAGGGCAASTVVSAAAAPLGLLFDCPTVLVMMSASARSSCSLSCLSTRASMGLTWGVRAASRMGGGSGGGGG